MTIILIYTVYFFLIVRFCIVLFNYISNPKLPAAPRNYYDFVSILLPGYNDQAQLARLLQSIKEQDFENYEVIILADDPVPATRRFAEIFFRGDQRFRVIGKKQVPGRNGELNNDLDCGHLASQAKGDYLLFLDGADRVENGLIYNVLYRMKIHSLSLLSLFADQKMKTFGEGQVTPLINYVLLNLLPLRLVLLSRNKRFAAASRQFMMFRTSDYQAFQWHREAGERPDNVICIMKKIKELGFRTETLLANGYVSGRIYAGFRQGMKSFSKSLISGFENNIPALLIYLLLCGPAYLFILPLLSIQLIGMALALIVGMRVMVSLMSNQPVWWNLLFHPLQITVMITALTSSIYRIVVKNT